MEDITGIFCGTSDQFLVTNSDEDGNEITTTYNAADYCIGKTPEQLLEDEHGCNYIEKLEVYNPYNYGSVTVKEFRDSLFAHVGIPQENVTLINDAVQITKTLESTELHFSDCVKAICQINAVFGHISETGYSSTSPCRTVQRISLAIIRQQLQHTKNFPPSG